MIHLRSICFARNSIQASDGAQSTMLLKLVTDNEELRNVCLGVESHIGWAEELADRTWPVELLQSFAAFPEAQQNSKYADTPAAYRPSTATIYVNASTFFVYAAEHQRAILAHELGHAVRDQTDFGAVNQEGGLHECMWADWLVCKWGYANELIDERRRSRGDEYAAALELWESRTDFASAMAKYRMRKIAGLI